MDASSYDALLDQQAGFTPGIVVTPQQLADYNPSLVQSPDKNHVIPFGGLVLPFHEVVFSAEDEVHEFVRSHFTRRLRQLTVERPLYVRSYPITGWTVLAQLSRKGLIVDADVRSIVHRLVQSFPSPLKFTTKPHLLNQRWHFYTLAANHRTLVSNYLEQQYPMAAQAGAHREFHPKSSNSRLPPNPI